MSRKAAIAKRMAFENQIYQDEEQEYVTSGAKLKCNKGTEETILVVPCVGTLGSSGRPKANVTHRDPNQYPDGNFEDEEYFGNCMMLAKQEVLRERSEGNQLTNISEILASVKMLVNEIEEMLESDISDIKCRPVLDSDWAGGIAGTYVGDDYALSDGCYLYCTNGGGRIEVVEAESDRPPDLIGKALIRAWMHEHVGNDAWGSISQVTVNEINATLYRNGITPSERGERYRTEIAHLMSQVAVETEYGRHLVEYLPGGNERQTRDFFNVFYGPPLLDGRGHAEHFSMGNHLGNDSNNNGSRFRGAGGIQITWRVNYQAFAIYLLIQREPRLYQRGFRAINPDRPRGTFRDGRILEPDHMPYMRSRELINEDSDFDETALIIDEVYERILDELRTLGICDDPEIRRITDIVTEGAEHVARYFPWSSLDWFWQEKVRPVFDLHGAGTTSAHVTAAINYRTDTYERREDLFDELIALWDEWLGEGRCFACGEVHYN